FCCFFFQCSVDPLALHSFPTRRSSDLHRVVHLVLADGREVLVSPGHKTADGRPVGTLNIGDILDGSTIMHLELVPYAAGQTYDLLPSGATGHYWANGILLSSTLAHR